MKLGFLGSIFAMSFGIYIILVNFLKQKINCKEEKCEEERKMIFYGLKVFLAGLGLLLFTFIVAKA